jgi:mono/diheme cytochrome c family protein
MIVRLAILLLAVNAGQAILPVQAAPLTPAEKRGRHIYQHGESSAGRPITALAGGAEMSAGIFACGTCHGADGRGVPEGSVEPSDIRWETLQKIVMTGRKRPRYDEERLARAVREGVDSAGNELSPVMPRFRMSKEDLADLLAYLERLGNEPQPGLASDSITVTTAAPGMARSVIEAYFRDVNAAGGIFGRTLKIADVAPGDAFAVIGATEGVESKFDGERVPLITPFPTALPAPSSFFLFSDLETQALALLNHAGTRPVDVLHDGSPAAVAAAEALEPRTSVTSFDALATAERADDDLLFLLGAGIDTKSVVRGLQSLQWKPRVMIAGANVTEDIFDAPVPVFVAVPTLPSDLTGEGRTEVIAFAERHTLPTDRLAPQLATYAAVKVFVEGLKRSGRDLTREKLITSLEQLYQFPTGVTPPISYAKKRHIGSTGAHILTVDPKARVFVTVRPASDAARVQFQ